eukprot:scaffold56866_cov37-Prasinocladus_malaysianus.AAC.1
MGPDCWAACNNPHHPGSRDARGDEHGAGSHPICQRRASPVWRCRESGHAGTHRGVHCFQCSRLGLPDCPARP